LAERCAIAEWLEGLGLALEPLDRRIARRAVDPSVRDLAHPASQMRLEGRVNAARNIPRTAEVNFPSLAGQGPGWA
jgi:hypothetical protein